MKPLMTAKIGQHTTAASRQKLRHDTKARDALELLTAASTSRPEPLLLMHGLESEMLADLVHTGLAAVQSELVKAAGRSVEVVRFKITDAGRRALHAQHSA